MFKGACALQVTSNIQCEDIYIGKREEEKKTITEK
jgi:hypothetical protein